MSIVDKGITQNVTVNGRRTSMKLEPENWKALEDICRWEGLSLHEICSLVDDLRDTDVASETATAPTRTSTVRAFIISYFRQALHDLQQLSDVVTDTRPTANSAIDRGSDRLKALLAPR
ncbi:ribbon-helix-helix domain-containing protein [Magnetospira sp. QH-2]|uniref:ribbon-helix-helix domain-containing protein n=1 Tax=Magnetospira sp. (strain QH-2) TaxID=1288970 RepID=UPI0003E80BC4|nr:ribbon-helix-helix domain-containing protein [Magnetospira sp. QH-2]CCQ74633.1 protein of unknown function [Magnetospira sp. QH-2]